MTIFPKLPFTPWFDYYHERRIEENQARYELKQGDPEAMDRFVRSQDPVKEYFWGNHTAHPCERIIPFDKIHIIPVDLFAGVVNSVCLFGAIGSSQPGFFGVLGTVLGLAIGVPLGIAATAIGAPIDWLRVEAGELFTGKTTYHGCWGE